MSAVADGYEQEEAEELRVGVTDRGLLQRLVRYLRPYAPQVGFAILLIAAVAALGIASPLLVKMAIDRALEGDATEAARRTMIWQIGGAYVAILVATAGLYYGQIMLLQTIGQNVMLDLRRQLFRHVVRQDLTLFDRQPVGDP